MWRIFDVYLVWKFFLTDITTDAAVPTLGNIPEVPAINASTGATLAITDAKLYIPIVSPSTEDNNKLLAQLKTGFKRAIKWNKYRSEMTNQPKTNNLNHLIDPAFSKLNRLFILSFKIKEDEDKDERTSFSKYHRTNVEIKDFNVLIDGNSFSDVPVKNKEETYDKIIEMSKNNDYTTGNLLDYEYFLKHYKLIAIDLSKQFVPENPHLKPKKYFYW